MTFRKQDVLGCTATEYCASLDRKLSEYELIGLREDKFGCGGDTVFDMFLASVPPYIEVVVNYREYGLIDTNICSTDSVVSAYGTGLALREDLEKELRNQQK